MAHSLDQVWSDSTTKGGWTVYLDELRLFTDPKYLGLAPRVERLWLFGRSRKITVIAGTQAPRWVPAAFYEQSRHHFIFRVQDTRAIKRLGEIGGDVDAIEATVPTLESHEFLYIDPKGQMVRSRVSV